MSPIREILEVCVVLALLLSPLRDNFDIRRLSPNDGLTLKQRQKLRQEIRLGIEKLASPDYRVRHQATVALSEIGPPARTQLLQALKSSDAEVELRSKILLRLIDVAELWLPSLVTYSAEQVPFSDVIADIAAQTRNTVQAGDAFNSFNQVPMTIHIERLPFWEAIDTVCRLCGNHIRSALDPKARGVTLVSGAPGVNPIAYSGPLRAELTSAQLTFIDRLDFKTDDSDVTHDFTMKFQVLWESHFRLLAYQPEPEVVRATTDAGEDLCSIQSSDGGWKIVDPNTRELTFKLHLDPPKGASKLLDVLQVRLGLVAVGDMQTLIVSDLSNLQPYSHEDAELQVEEVRLKGPHWEITVVVSRENGLPDPPEVLFYENKFVAYDAAGNPLMLRSQSHSLTDEGARLVLSFVSRDGSGEPKSLRFDFPRIRSERHLEFSFRDVPIPRKRY